MMAQWTAAPITLAIMAAPGATAARGIEGVRIHLEQASEEPGRLSLGEVLTLVATTTNKGSAPVEGRLAEGPFAPGMAFYSRRGSGAPVRLDEPYDPYDVMGKVYGAYPSIVLRPGQSTTVRGEFVLNPRTNALWLPEPGRYEFFVVRRPSEQLPSLEIRSNTVTVVVSDAPERFRAAFDAFISAQLGLLLFDPVTRLREEPRVASVAEAFFRRHAETPYGRQVHKSLLHGLRTRISTSQASALETDVYERIETNESIRRGVGLGPRR